MMRQALALLLTLALEAPSSAQLLHTVLPSNTPAPVSVAVPAIPAADLSSRSLLLQHDASLPLTQAPADFSAEPLPVQSAVLPLSSIPTIEKPSVHHRKAGLRRHLQSAVSALFQAPSARKAFPILGRLGTSFLIPSADLPLEEQRSAIQSNFEQKAFGTDSKEPALLGFEGKGRRFLSSTISARKRQEAPSAAKKKAPSSSPARTITYNGHKFPSVLLRPEADMEKLLVSAVDSAKEEIVLAISELRSYAVYKALKRARAHGRKVRILTALEAVYPTKPGHPEWPDRRDPQLELLISDGFDISVVSGLWIYGMQRSRLAVIDKTLAIAGSGHWSSDAESNEYANSTVTDDPHRVQGFLRFLNYMHQNSIPLDQAHSWDWPTTMPPSPQDKDLPIHFNGARLPAFFFSPMGNAEDLIIKAIDATQESLDVCMFIFQSTRIAQALLRARTRGVDIRILLDQTHAQREYMRPYAEWLAWYGFKVKTLGGPKQEKKSVGRNNNAFMIADNRLVETGTMNWTKNSTSMNFEHGQFLDDAQDIETYRAYFAALYTGSKAKYALPPEAEPSLPSDQELLKALEIPHPPLPPTPEFPRLPRVPSVTFNGQALPSIAVLPQTPIAPLLVKAIDAVPAYGKIRLALYEFNLQEVLEALRRAKNRKADVELILDYGHVYPSGDGKRTPQVHALLDEGFTVYALRGLGKSGIMHNKFGLFFDASGKGLLEFGSYNWTDTSERNHFENVQFTDEKPRVAAYERYWEWMKGQSLDAFTDAALVQDEPQEFLPVPPNDATLAVRLNGRLFPRQVFSPLGGLEDAVVAAIEAAEDSIEIAMFSFYSRRVAEALLVAKNKRRKVRIVLDASQSKVMELDAWFLKNGFDVKILAGPDPHGPWRFEKNHNKFMRIDGKFVAAGSANYTTNADQSSYENINFSDDRMTAGFYGAYFDMLYDLGWPPTLREQMDSANEKTSSPNFFERLESWASDSGLDSDAEFPS
jgi:phosphatidylserine/phosphatidylglycerophosphate/cardiolipin synthase-like enzyme